jgi:hypothetical protein
LFETLLENTEINFKHRKRMMDVAFDWRPIYQSPSHFLTK